MITQTAKTVSQLKNAARQVSEEKKEKMFTK